MGLLSDRAYIDHSKTPLLFLASEDSRVIHSMNEWVVRHHRKYEMLITEVFDRKGLLAERSAEERNRKPAGGPDHHPDEYLSMLLNVHYLTRANAYVCTLSSNFCRVIDELRATVAAKADRPFVDLSIETCSQPPCLYDNIFYLDW